MVRLDNTMNKFKLVGRSGLLVLVAAVLGVGAIGFWAGNEYKAREIRNAISDAFTEATDDSTTQRAEVEPLKDVDIVKVKQGEVMKFATIDVVFISAKSTDMLTPEYGSPIVADQGTKFVIVKHTVTNTTKAEFAYEVLPILDSEDKMYSHYSDAYGLSDSLVYETIAPAIPKTGVTVYQVPAETTNFTFGAGKGGTDQFLGTDFIVD